MSATRSARMGMTGTTTSFSFFGVTSMASRLGSRGSPSSPRSWWPRIWSLWRWWEITSRGLKGAICFWILWKASFSSVRKPLPLCSRLGCPSRWKSFVSCWGSFGRPGSQMVPPSWRSNRHRFCKISANWSKMAWKIGRTWRGRRIGAGTFARPFGRFGRAVAVVLLICLLTFVGYSTRSAPGPVTRPVTRPSKTSRWSRPRQRRSSQQRGPSHRKSSRSWSQPMTASSCRLQKWRRNWPSSSKRLWWVMKRLNSSDGRSSEWKSLWRRVCVIPLMCPGLMIPTWCTKSVPPSLLTPRAPMALAASCWIHFLRHQVAPMWLANTCGLASRYPSPNYSFQFYHLPKEKGRMLCFASVLHILPSLWYHYPQPFQPLRCELRYKGTKILTADNSTILEVAAPPEQHSAPATVHLQAQDAKLQVTLDHRVVLANGYLAACLTSLSNGYYPMFICVRPIVFGWLLQIHLLLQS